MAVCIECNRDMVGCYEIKTKRGSVIYICKDCAQKNKRKEGSSADNSSKSI